MADNNKKADVLRRFFSSFNNEEIDIIEEVLACEGKLSKREAYYDNDQSSNNFLNKLIYNNKRSFGADKSISPYPTLFS